MPLFFCQLAHGLKPQSTKPLGSHREQGRRYVGGLINQLWPRVNVDSAGFAAPIYHIGKLRLPLAFPPHDGQRFLNEGVRLSMKAAMPSF